MAESENRLSQWVDRWGKGATAWHLQDVNPHVVKFASKFLRGANKRVFVPLCGKTIDMKWLYDQGHTVIGVEGVESAVLEFATEQKLEMQKEKVSCGVCYKTTDNRLTIYVCDLFILTPEIVGKFDAVWDRGSLVAINECDREKYAKLILSLMKPSFRILIHTFEYIPPSTGFPGPSSFPGDLIQKLYGCYQQELHRDDVVDFFAEKGMIIDKIDEVVWLLSDEQEGKSS